MSLLIVKTKKTDTKYFIGCKTGKTLGYHSLGFHNWLGTPVNSKITSTCPF